MHNHLEEGKWKRWTGTGAVRWAKEEPAKLSLQSQAAITCHAKPLKQVLWVLTAHIARTAASKLFLQDDLAVVGVQRRSVLHSVVALREISPPVPIVSAAHVLTGQGSVVRLYENSFDQD